MHAENNLTRDEARERFRIIQHPLYQVFLDLTAAEDTFTCDATVNFLCSEPGASSFIDFYPHSVDSLELNGAEVPRDAFTGTRIRLDNLKAANELHVLGTCDYQNIGVGLSRFKDPVDDRVYLHTQFETFDAHRVFPCFDQPDLKATFDFTVFAPEDWVVVSNTQGRSDRVEGRAGIKRWTFPTTPKMSTYLTAIVAGPFQVVREKHGDIDIGLYCRESLRRYLDTDELFAITRQGLDFFSKAYNYPYPFGKYDQLFVPEFSAGAMENIAAVTHHEYMIFRSRVTEAEREDRANTILHEMAHMWFGDLVTTRWWDDLWLNESFATFMSVLAQVEATRFRNGWVTFANEYKTGARRQDQLPTTHPIAADIKDIESVYLNFDAITYNKGACVLRQLVAWVGQDTFLRGVERYLRKREYGNASLREFLADIEEGSGRDLAAWSKDWLETAGLNTLTPTITTRDDRISALTIKQEAPLEYPTLRSHRLAVGLYDRNEDGLKLRRRVELDVSGATSPVSELQGERQADLLLVNDLDLTYAKIRLDERSLSTARHHLKEMKDPLARALCWAALWDMLRDAVLPARQFLQTVLNNIHGETDIGVVRDLLAKTASAVDVYGDPDNSDTAEEQVARFALDAIERSEPGSDVQLTWTHALIGAGRSPEHLALVRGLLDGTTRFEGLKVDTDLRWMMVNALSGRGAAGDDLIAAELERDPTDEGQRHAASARAGRPNPDAKQQAWTTITEDAQLSLATMRSIMRGFHRFDQRRLLEPYVSKYFAALDPIWKSREIEVAIAFARSMYPTVIISDEVVRVTGERLNGQTPGPIRRILLESRDNMQRAIRGRALDASASEKVTAPR